MGYTVCMIFRNERGMFQVFLVLGLAFVLTFLMFATPSEPGQGVFSLNLIPPSGGSEGGSQSTGYSIRIDTSGVSQTDSRREYIVLTNVSSSPVNISGMTLENGKGQRVYRVGSETRTFPSDRTTIPQGVRLYRPDRANAFTPIVLAPGEKAVVVTGNLPPHNNIPRPSQLLNMCSGYLQEGRDAIPFSPRIGVYCPDIATPAEISSFDSSCQSYIRGISPCHTSITNECVRASGGGVECGYVDGRYSLANSCVAFLNERANYEGCISAHGNDPKFYTGEWRVFLNQGFEFWANSDEVITLYDSAGRIVSQLSY